jgi:REP element-mobilizing transposase RayT
VLRGNHRQPIFRAPDDYLWFEAVLEQALDRYGARLLAYCWMTNHVHLAVQVGEAPLGEVMRVTASRYARRLQRAVPTTGHLFERRYWARLLDAPRHLAVLARYIHLNPVRAAMVADPCDYRWSSHAAYLGVQPPPRWLAIEPLLAHFGAPDDTARRAYLQFMAGTPGEDEFEQLRVRASPGRPKAGTRESQPPLPARAAAVLSPPTLEAIAAAVANQHGIRVADLTSRRRTAVLVRARTEVARRALREGVATLSQVARHLHRAPSSLSRLLNDHGGRPR